MKSRCVKQNLPWRRHVVSRACPSVLPHYFELYVEHVCPLRSDCIELMAAPDIREQALEVSTFKEIQVRHDIRGLEGIILLAIAQKDTGALEDIMRSADTYSEVLDHLRRLVELASDGGYRGVPET